MALEFFMNAECQLTNREDIKMPPKYHDVELVIFARLFFFFDFQHIFYFVNDAFHLNTWRSFIGHITHT